MKIILQENSKEKETLERPHLHWEDCIKIYEANLYPDVDWHLIATNPDVCRTVMIEYLIGLNNAI